MLNYDSYADKYDSRYTSDMCVQENIAIYQAIVQIPLYKTKKILDLGCGTGFFLDLFFDDYKVFISNYLEIDISNEMIKCARKKYPQGKFVVEDSRKISDVIEKNNFQFDIAISLFTIPYIGTETIESVYEKLPNGGLFFTVYYDKPYLNSSSVYNGRREYYEKEVLPRVNNCVECMKKLFIEEYNFPMTEFETYRIALYRK